MEQANFDTEKKEKDLELFNLQCKVEQLTRQIDNQEAIFNQNLKQIQEICIDCLKSRPYRVAYFLHRISMQVRYGGEHEKRDFNKWISAKILNKPRRSKYNPFIDILDIYNGIYREINNKNLDYYKELLIKKFTPMKDGVYFDYISKEYERLDRVTEKSDLENNSTKLVYSIIKNSKYKGIIIYPPVIPWEPFQTPQQLLVSFAKRGYLCFFTEHDGEGHKGVFCLEKNLWAVPESDLLKAIHDKEVIIMLTWMGSIPFVSHIQNAKIWYHILDQIDIFTFYDYSYESMHNEIIKKAEWTSYVSKPLTKYLENRADAIYLPNACHAEELIEIKKTKCPADFSEIVKSGKPIIGYFGWIDEWMDFNILMEVAEEKPDCQFVMIGPINYNNKKVSDAMNQLKKQRNIYFLGRKKYEDLPGYAKRFNIAIIPFLINDMMDCVSPIKFYEYCAYGLPTITSYMPEMDNYRCSFVECYRTKKEFVKLIDLFLDENTQIEAQKKAPKIALENTWISRIKTMETAFAGGK